MSKEKKLRFASYSENGTLQESTEGKPTPKIKLYHKTPEDELRYLIINNESEENILRILNSDIQINHEFHYEQTILHIAIKNNLNARIVRAILNKNAYINAIDRYGYSALHYALMQITDTTNYPPINNALLLLGFGANIFLLDNENFAFYYNHNILTMLTLTPFDGLETLWNFAYRVREYGYNFQIPQKHQLFFEALEEALYQIYGYRFQTNFINLVSNYIEENAALYPTLNSLNIHTPSSITQINEIESIRDSIIQATANFIRIEIVIFDWRHDYIPFTPQYEANIGEQISLYQEGHYYYIIHSENGNSFIISEPESETTSLYGESDFTFANGIYNESSPGTNSSFSETSLILFANLPFAQIEEDLDDIVDVTGAQRIYRDDCG